MSVRDYPTIKPPADYMGIRVLAVLGMMPVGLAGALLLCVAETWMGRICALLALSVAALPWLGLTALVKRRRSWTVAVAGHAGLTIVMLTLVLYRAPSGSTDRSARVSNQYAWKQPPASRFTPGNLVPEVDQLMCGFTVMPLVDRLFTVGKAAELKRMTVGIYRELDADPEFAALGSVMGDTYADMLGFSGKRVHAYVYVPASLDRTEPAPLLVFFHGSGGNFKAYLWILSELADRLGCIVVAPTNGLGQWQVAESLDALLAAENMAQLQAKVDPRRIHVIGLSNGGLALSQLVVTRAEQVRSFIFLSPVFDERMVGQAEFARQCPGKPMLILTGDRDERVPLDYVERNVGRMQRAGAAARLETLPADHFLLFSHRRELQSLLEQWISVSK